MTTDDHTALRCLFFGIGMTVLFAAWLFVTPSARAAGMPCTHMSNKDVLAHIEAGSKETVRFVGAMSDGASGVPMELTVSDDGTWTFLVLTPDGTCFVAVGTSWQAVEQKPAGVEN